MLSPGVFYCFCNEIPSQLHMVHIHSYHSFFLCVSYFYFTELGMQHLPQKKKKKKTQMVQPPKDQDGSFFSKLHCKPQYKFPLIEKGKSENLEGQIPVLLSKSAGSCCQEPSDRDPLPHCQHKRERKDGRETFRNCTENARFLLLSGVLSFGCLKRNWAEWGRDVFWST